MMLARPLVFLVMLSDSTECERVFSCTEHLRKNLHEQRDGQLVEQYLWVRQGPPVPKSMQVVEQATICYLRNKERRPNVSVHVRVYYKGRKVNVSRRRIRSDAGSRGVLILVKVQCCDSVMVPVMSCH